MTDAPRDGDRLRHGLLANAGAKLLVVVLGIVAVPFYLRYLGVDAYGIVGLYTVLVSLSLLLDAGFGTATSRFVSLHAPHADPDSRARIRELVRTLEGFYWLVAVVLAALAVPGAFLAAGLGFSSGTLPVETVRTGLALMLVAVALQFPFSLYGNGLLGLQRHVAHNGLLAGGALARVGGGIVVLAFVSATIEAFMAWQMLVALAQSLLGAVALWRRIPGPERAPFRPAILRPTLRFAAGAGAVTVFGALLAHADKLVVGARLGLEDLGYYNLGVVVASSVYTLAVPTLTVFFPRLTRLVDADPDERARAYHLGTRLVAVSVVPAAVVAAALAPELLWAWTGDRTVAAAALAPARLLVLAAALVALNGIPHALQMAHGRPSLAVGLAVAGLVVGVPAYLIAVDALGRTGAAATWLLVAFLTTATSVTYTHLRLLPGHGARWLGDVLPAALASALVAGLALAVRPDGLGRLGAVGFLVAVSALALGAALLATPQVRTLGFATLKSLTRGTGSR